ncbi:DUF3784 domain-containing protein [Algoriphagus sp. H41]|uniref:DUF3784 domain-containing protein n=1 Tax=Algoriphagus oliviformis TaxID=2811231 RepID=A0ABS3BZ76_9BACT|nr:DUF3784 domain-containing protein [Algoriphagus oliviformis]MBN7810158.1 DUF3784 domain-containing protein [Algoriphagus oliviformis]
MIAIAILFIVLGALVKYGKMHFLIAGYSSLSSSEKDRIDVDSVANVFRNGFFGMAAVILAAEVYGRFTGDLTIQKPAFFAAIFIGLPYVIIASNLKKNR